MKRIYVAKALAALGLALVSAASHAELVKYEFTAHAIAASLSGDVAGSPAGGPANFINVGTTFTGYFYYDLTTPKAYDGDNGAGGMFAGYVGNTSQVGISFTSSSGYQFKSNDFNSGYTPSVDIEDGATGSASPHDFFSLFGRGDTAANFQQDTTLKLTDKHNGATLNSAALPATLSLADYSGDVSFYWSDGGSRSFNATFALDSLAPVPEPETYAMLLAGLALTGAMARRRKQQA